MNYPTADNAKRFVASVKHALFPEYYLDPREADAVSGEDPYADVREIAAKLLAPDVVEAFMLKLPDIKASLLGDAEATAHNDPAVQDIGEVMVCYPVMVAMIHYRIAHELLLLDVPMLPRLITELAHSATGIDIHPQAQIGEHFSIDHGTGVVIGATSIIGNHVMLYQGVTLGAKNFKYDEAGHPIDEPRHPIIEDNVTIYSNASILGRIRIGHDTIIGGNVWLTHDVPPGSRVLQGKASTQPLFSDGAGI